MMHENLQVIQKMLRSIHQMLGDRYEVILHDLSHVESSIVGIEGSITPQKDWGTGDELPDSIAERVRG